MADVSIVGEAALAMIGVRGPKTPALSMGALGVHRYCEATNDENLIYKDPELAAEHGYSGLPVPPLLIGQNMIGFELLEVPLETKRPGGVLASWKWEFLRPVHQDDPITAEDHIVNIREKAGPFGMAAHIDHEITFRDVHGEQVAIARLTRVRY